MDWRLISSLFGFGGGGGGIDWSKVWDILWLA